MKSNMLALLLVAAHKGFWQVDEQTLQQLAQQFAEQVIEHGLPGSGHTRPEHPMMQWIKPMLNETSLVEFEKLIAAAKGTTSNEAMAASPTSIAEISVDEQGQSQTSQEPPAHEITPLSQLNTLLISLLLLAIISGGFFYGRYKV